VRRSLLAAGALCATVACGTPPRGPCDPDPEPGSLGSVCGFESPEDVEHVPSARLLLVSEMRRGETGGGLAALRLDTGGIAAAPPRRLWPAGRELAPDGRGAASCTAPPADEEFAPHGIHTGAPGRDGSVPLAVVNHGGRESIELFDLEGRGDEARLRWRGCVPMPPGTAGNDVSVGASGALAVSNYQPTLHGWRGTWHMLRGGLGFVTGDVRVWSSETGWRTLEGSRAANPNGVLWSADGSGVLFAETNAGAIRFAVARAGGDDPPEAIEVGGRPDNLARSPRGSVLVVTHLTGVGFLACNFGRRPCRTAWALIEVEPDLSSATELLRHDGEALGAAASAAEVAGRFYIGAVFDDRIGVWNPEDRAPR
jgi:hypothetical protein